MFSLDQPERIPTLNIGNCEYFDFLDRPYATFHFKYRSRRKYFIITSYQDLLIRDPEALQAELIIPRSPSPVPLEERPEESLTREELLELLARTRRSVRHDFALRSFRTDKEPESHQA